MESEGVGSGGEGLGSGIRRPGSEDRVTHVPPTLMLSVLCYLSTRIFRTCPSQNWKITQESVWVNLFAKIFHKSWQLGIDQGNTHWKTLTSNK